MATSRRAFLGGTLAASSATWLGCVDDATPGVMQNGEDSGAGGGGPADAGVTPVDSGVGANVDSGVTVDAGQAAPDASQIDAGAMDAGQPPVMCPDPFEGGTMEGINEIISSGTAPLDRPLGSGLDGRLYTDLETLDENSLITPNDTFYIRTRTPGNLDLSAPWNVRMHGLVDSEVNLSMADIEARVRSMGVVLLECSGNGDFAHFGMLSAAEWGGVPMMEILSLANISPSATRVLISGFDDHTRTSANSTEGASWVFTFDQLAQTGAFLATTMNGVPLPSDHGFPVRLVVPRWYGCTNIKWVNEIRLVDDSIASTSQMREFASRTHQSGTPRLARDFAAASMHQAAMPVRVERWRVNGQVTYKVVGILWGGERPTDKLQIRFGRTGQYQDVNTCPMHAQNNTWTLWSHQWTPTRTGTYNMHCRINDSSVPQRRLNSGFYDRAVRINEV